MKQLMYGCAVLVGSAGTALAQEDPTGSWAGEAAAYYFARGGSATDGTYFYLFGGYQLGVSQSYPSYYRRARRYDPAANAWVTLANLPIAFSDITYQYSAGAHYGGQLYSFGTSHQGANGIVLSYSIANDAWTVLAGVAVPESRYSAAAAVLGNKIYLSGGFANGASRRMDEFDPADNTFTQLADLPEGVYLHAMTAVPARGSLFVVGGTSQDGYVDTCYEFSPASNAWTERAPLVTDGVSRPRGSLAAFTLRNRVYATGGRSNAGASAAVFEYHPATDTWAQRATMAYARYQHGAVAIAGRGYVYGGLPVYSEGEEFTPPDFGPGPEFESEIAQSGSQPESTLQATEDPTKRDGWTNGQVGFSAVISDPDPDDLVRLRVRIRRPGEPVWMQLESGLVEQGTVQIYFTLPTKGPYDWEYRIEDADDNSIPADVDSWLPAFGNDSTPDLRCDRVPPSDPVGLYPKAFDVPVGDPAEGDVTFGWTEGTDEGPALVHDLEIARAGEREAFVTIPAGTGKAAIRLPVWGGIRTWRVRARDIGGNVSAWSEPLLFRVVHDDRINHAAGDGADSCAFGASPSASWVVLLLAGLLAVGSHLHGRRRVNP